MKYLLLTTLSYILKSNYASLCNGVDYNFGKWIEDISLLAKPEQNFICCNDDVRNNIQLNKFCPPGIQIEDHGCSCLHRHLKVNKIDPTKATEQAYRYNVSSVKYKWNSDRCELTTWNAYEFCQLLGTKTVLMLGDSTSNQATGVLKSMIFQTNVTDTALLKCSEQIRFMWSDVLIAPHINGGGGRGYSIAQSIMDEYYAGRNYDYFIFGGFHFNYVSKVLTKHNKSEVILDAAEDGATDPRFAGSALVKIQEHINIVRRFYEHLGKPAPHIIYKSVSVPHDQCAMHFDKGPNTAITNEQQLALLNAKGLGKKYHWNDEMAVEQALIRHLIGANDISVLRLFPLDSRPDGHPPEAVGDCLHYCAPGPLNIFPQIFQHFLKVGVKEWRKNDTIYGLEQPARKRRLRA